MIVFNVRCKAFVPFNCGNGIPLLLPSLSICLITAESLLWHITCLLFWWYSRECSNYEGNFDFILGNWHKWPAHRNKSFVRRNLRKCYRWSSCWRIAGSRSRCQSKSFLYCQRYRLVRGRPFDFLARYGWFCLGKNFFSNLWWYTMTYNGVRFFSSIIHHERYFFIVGITLPGIFLQGFFFLEIRLRDIFFLKWRIPPPCPAPSPQFPLKSQIVGP